MAIKNYLTPGSYTHIVNTIYEKQLKRCTIVLDICSDNTKSLVLANKGISVDGSRKHISIFSLANQLHKTPSQPSDEMHYIISASPEEELLGYEGQVTVYNSITQNWDKWILWDGLIAFVEDEQKYYLRSNEQWVEQKEFTEDKRIWDKWFAPEVALAEGTNPTKQMYEFMKTLEQFKDCEDV